MSSHNSRKGRETHTGTGRTDESSLRRARNAVSARQSWTGLGEPHTHTHMHQHRVERTHTHTPAAAHPAELLQQSMVLLRELADGPGLVSVSLPQLDLVALQLALQLLDVRLQLGHAALPLALSTLQTPTQFVLLLCQVLRARGEGG